jgi:hypothetical protein
MLTSKGLKGPKRADKAPVRRRADKRSPKGVACLECVPDRISECST